jgi:serine/threonine protein kinase
VLIDDGRRARLTDFGLSKIKTSLTTQTTLDAVEVGPRVPGTKVYMAPERLRRGTMTYSTDVYAFSMSAVQVRAVNTYRRPII